jgi:hypothetical protein
VLSAECRSGGGLLREVVGGAYSELSAE